MKKLSLIFCALLFVQVSFAQNTPAQQKLLDKMSDDACVEMQKINTDGLSREDVNLKLGLAILPVFEKYKSDIEKQFNLNPNSSEDARVLGEKLGQTMVSRCDKMVEITKILLKDKEFREDVNARINTSKKLTEVTGTVTKITEEDFCYVYFTTENGDILKLTLLFNTSDETQTTNLLKGKYNNKQLKLSYFTEDTYSIKEKKFKPLKVIYSFSEN